MKRVLVVPIGWGIAAVMLAGISLAVWRSAGTGGGTTTSGSLQIVTLGTVSAQPGTLLQPGGVGDLVLNVSNPNAQAMTVTDVDAAGAITVTGGSGCTAANSGVSFANQSGLAKSVAGSATTVVQLSNVVAMSTLSVTGCQGATFSIPVTIIASTQ